MRNWKNRRGALLAGVAMAAVISTTAAAQAGPVNFDIASGDLGDALGAYAKQSGVELFYQSRIVEGRSTQGLHGSFAPRDALDQLLKGTGLVLAMDQSGAMVVREAAAPQSGSAAGDGADQGTVQALIVTAQKREENIQDVPIAMSAFSQEDLTRSQVAGGPDLMTQVPNFTFTKTNFSSYSIQIRGIGTQAISATTDAAVAVAFNNTPFIRNRFFEQEFYDLQRVEVLRGPQGTLYGRNATAGVVNIISQKPKFAYESRLSLDLSNYKSHRLEGMLNIPLVDDKVALRLAGAWTKRDGYATNALTGAQIDGRDLWSTRLSLRFTPTDRIDANLIWEHFQEDDDRLRSGKQLCKRNFPATIGGVTVPYGHTAPGQNNGMLYEQYFSQGCEAASLYSPDSFQAPNGLRLPYYRALSGAGLPIVQFNPDGTPFDPYASTVQSRDLRVIESTVEPRYKAKTDTAELQVNFDLTDQLTLTSETAYLADRLFSTQDYNRFNTQSGAFEPLNPFGQPNEYVAEGVLDEKGVFCDPQIGCADRLVAVDLSTADSRQFSQEFRVASNFDGPFNFSLGANFLRYDTEDKYYVFINTLSMYAAHRSHFIQSSGDVPPYQGGVSDNHECLPNGFEAPDPNGVETINFCVYMDPNPIGALNDLGHNYFLSRNPFKLISYAVFGESYYNITDNLKLTAGLRWTVDQKAAPRIPSWILAADTVGYPVAETVRQDWREPTGRLTLDWKPDLAFSDETLLYASYAHGYKAGGMNPPANGIVLYLEGEGRVDTNLIAQQQNANSPRTFAPEFVDAFEVGAKNTLLDGRLTLNGAAFYYDYRGYQISQIVNRAAINLNFDAKVWGLELEADWRPLENLRLGFKGGYEDTRVADGSKALDVMDRTAGNPNWYVTGPFPSLASNCVLPTYTVTQSDGDLAVLGAASGGGVGPCEYAYVFGYDPLTMRPYQANPANPGDLPEGYYYAGYPGFDPQAGTPGHPYTGQNTYNGVDYGPAPNGGAGFYKDLSGNALPNAPHFTATVTADYTIPMPNNWLATLHTDLYYQSEAWTRIFNTPGYDKLKAYTNVNVAAIFSNEDAGWKIMAYIKNVMDRDSITGAFLNSDDTGLTTNVFLTEPRLYGLRVTKDFAGGPWWTGANPAGAGPYRLTVEVGGQIQRNEGDYSTILPQALSAFEAYDITGAQHQRLDTGDGREVMVTYRPDGVWSVSAAMRYGRVNNRTSRSHILKHGDLICAVPAGLFANVLCDPTYSYNGGPPGQYYSPSWLKGATTVGDGSARTHEDHEIVDFDVGREVGLGGIKSSVTAGLRYASFDSRTDVTMGGIPDYYIPSPWLSKYGHFTREQGSLTARRQFKGAGPTAAWDAALPLMGSDQSGHLKLDWSVGGGILFGHQKTTALGEGSARYYVMLMQAGDNFQVSATDPEHFDLGQPKRSKRVSVPVVDLSLGISYDVGRVKVGTGYRWERYFNVLDTGYAERTKTDRTLDGPYFKIAVGFGG